jgi:hypothetical protein
MPNFLKKNNQLKRVSLTLWNLSVPAAEHGDGAGEFVNRKAFFTAKKRVVL